MSRQEVPKKIPVENPITMIPMIRRSTFSKIPFKSEQIQTAKEKLPRTEIHDVLPEKLKIFEEKEKELDKIKEDFNKLKLCSSLYVEKLQRFVNVTSENSMLEIDSKHVKSESDIDNLHNEDLVVQFEPIALYRMETQCSQRNSINGAKTELDDRNILDNHGMEEIKSKKQNKNGTLTGLELEMSVVPSRQKLKKLPAPQPPEKNKLPGEVVRLAEENRRLRNDHNGDVASEEIDRKPSSEHARSIRRIEDIIGDHKKRNLINSQESTLSISTRKLSEEIKLHLERTSGKMKKQSLEKNQDEERKFDRSNREERPIIRNVIQRNEDAKKREERSQSLRKKIEERRQCIEEKTEERRQSIKKISEDQNFHRKANDDRGVYVRRRNEDTRKNEEFIEKNASATQRRTNSSEDHGRRIEDNRHSDVRIRGDRNGDQSTHKTSQDLKVVQRRSSLDEFNKRCSEDGRRNEDLKHNKCEIDRLVKRRSSKERRQSEDCKVKTRAIEDSIRQHEDIRQNGDKKQNEDHRSIHKTVDKRKIGVYRRSCEEPFLFEDHRRYNRSGNQKHIADKSLDRRHDKFSEDVQKRSKDPNFTRGRGENRKQIEEIRIENRNSGEDNRRCRRRKEDRWQSEGKIEENRRLNGEKYQKLGGEENRNGRVIIAEMKQSKDIMNVSGKAHLDKTEYSSIIRAKSEEKEVIKEAQGYVKEETVNRCAEKGALEEVAGKSTEESTGEFSEETREETKGESKEETIEGSTTEGQEFLHKFPSQIKKKRLIKKKNQYRTCCKGVNEEIEEKVKKERSVKENVGAGRKSDERRNSLEIKCDQTKDSERKSKRDRRKHDTKLIIEKKKVKAMGKDRGEQKPSSEDYGYFKQLLYSLIDEVEMKKEQVKCKKCGKTVTSKKSKKLGLCSKCRHVKATGDVRRKENTKKKCEEWWRRNGAEMITKNYSGRIVKETGKIEETRNEKSDAAEVLKKQRKSLYTITEYTEPSSRSESEESEEATEECETDLDTKIEKGSFNKGSMKFVSGENKAVGTEETQEFGKNEENRNQYFYEEDMACGTSDIEFEDDDFSERDEAIGTASDIDFSEHESDAYASRNCSECQIGEEMKLKGIPKDVFYAIFEQELHEEKKQSDADEQYVCCHSEVPRDVLCAFVENTGLHSSRESEEKLLCQIRSFTDSSKCVNVALKISCDLFVDRRQDRKRRNVHTINEDGAWEAAVDALFAEDDR